MTRDERRKMARYRRGLILVRDQLTRADRDQGENQIMRTVDIALGEPHRRACRCGFCQPETVWLVNYEQPVTGRERSKR